MNIAFVDDDQNMLRHIKQLLLQEFQENQIPIHRFDAYNNTASFLDGWYPGRYDLLLLDIFIDDQTGIDIGRKIRETDADVKIAFCTTTNEFASESYALNAIFYVRKPVTAESIQHLIQRLNLDDFEARRFVRLNDTKKVILRDIIYGEYHNHTIQIFTKSGQDIQVRMAFADFIELVTNYPAIISPSKGVFINLHEVKEKNSNDFIMSDGSIIPISRRKEKEVSTLYDDFLFSELRKEF